MAPKAFIELTGIKKIYTMGEHRVAALNGINLTVQRGEMLAIMGASGSGKSTLLHITGCLDKPTEGTYYLDGEDVSLLSNERLAFIRNKKIGFVFQNYNLLGRMNVLANVQLPLIYSRLDKKEMLARAKEALEWVGFSGFENYLPTQLSGGQQQRVAIARALVNRPSLILADEPTGALDSKSGEEIMSLLQKLNEEMGITVIVVTHEKEISLYCRRIVEIKDGRIVGTKEITPKKRENDTKKMEVLAN